MPSDPIQFPSRCKCDVFFSSYYVTVYCTIDNNVGNGLMIMYKGMVDVHLVLTSLYLTHVALVTMIEESGEVRTVFLTPDHSLSVSFIHHGIIYSIWFKDSK